MMVKYTLMLTRLGRFLLLAFLDERTFKYHLDGMAASIPDSRFHVSIRVQLQTQDAKYDD